MTAQETELQPYPSDDFSINGVKGQELQGRLTECIVNFLGFTRLSEIATKLQTTLVGKGAMLLMPSIEEDETPIKTYTSEAMHFRRGIRRLHHLPCFPVIDHLYKENFRCWDMEWELEIPADPTAASKPNYEHIQRAWWDAICAVYAEDDCPIRLPLEMRLTGGSNVVLAPQRGNKLGTISIEVLTTVTTPEDDWKSFCQKMTEVWASYKDSSGRLLNARPHWAKHWQGLNVRNKPINQYLKEHAFKDEFLEFKKGFEAIVTSRGGSVTETWGRFGEPTMRSLIFDA